MDMETASVLVDLEQPSNKSCNSHQTQTVNCDDENILIEALEAFRIKALSQMVISNPKKMCTKTFQ